MSTKAIRCEALIGGRYTPIHLESIRRCARKPVQGDTRCWEHGGTRKKEGP